MSEGAAQPQPAAAPEIEVGDRIVVIDFGSQYTQLLARRIRELGIYSEIQPHTADMTDILYGAEDHRHQVPPKGIVLSGGPTSAGERAVAYPAPVGIYQTGAPVLGVCYGMQRMVQDMGGQVQSQDIAQFGRVDLQIDAGSRLLGGLAPQDGKGVQVWASHTDQIHQLPQGFRATASGSHCKVAALEDPERGLYGVQFHPEVAHTPRGGEILRRFALDICGCEPGWNPNRSIELRVQELRATLGQDGVVLGISGGVDSTVCAALLARAIGERLVCVFVDNGLLRKGEADEVTARIQSLGVKLVRVEAADVFLRHLRNISDPERKRKVIGATFIEVFEREALKHPNIQWLAQGTIYPDVIESAGRTQDAAHVIKSHHNVGGLPDTMNLKLVEPLRDLFKDEVRQLGKALGLPEALTGRHPFPGPGLAVRTLGAVDAESLDALREADAIFIGELIDAGWYDKVSQAFVVFLPVCSTGVVGDRRRYANVVALRAVTTPDFMTAEATRLPWELLDKVSRAIVNQIPRISRVVYDVTGKPPGTIEWE